jgi:Holliday junction DNA helicase RuvA
LKDQIVILGVPSAATPAVESSSNRQSIPATEVNDDAVLAAVASDAVSALVNLGYGRSEAFTAVTRAARLQTGGVSVEILIPAALKELAG